MKNKKNRQPLLFWKLSLSFFILIITMLFMGCITYVLVYNCLLYTSAERRLDFESRKCR